MTAKVSIVIRCLNENQNLKILIPILLNQTERNFEIIFVDSGSDDGTLETISNYINKFENIYLYHINKNQFTFGKSLNIGFTESNADFKTVCTFAGFDHEYVRMKAKKYFKEKVNEKKDHLQSMQW